MLLAITTGLMMNGNAQSSAQSRLTSEVVTGPAADYGNSDVHDGSATDVAVPDAVTGSGVATGSGVYLDRYSATAYILDNINRAEAVFQVNGISDLSGCSLSCTSAAASMDIVVRKTCGMSDAFSLYTYNTGHTFVTVNLDEFVFDVELTVVRAPINHSSKVLDQGRSFRLQIKNYPEKPLWKSSDGLVATVDKNGRVRAKNIGNAIIYTDIDGYRTGCIVSVVKKGISKVVEVARFIGTHWKYSQPRRMSKGYYDCSSLVWKAYRQSGRYVCGLRNNAPVAADIGRWCISNKRRLGTFSKASIQKKEYLPGDVLLKVHMRSDRFMGIGHIEMITGYSLHGFIGTKPVLFLTWGAREEGYGASRKDDFVCRPYN
ncbi:MAG: hypothetical protein J5819_08500 [Eubacterium sp.]|nr:hypothetical protein [Eubacterium sp.]